MNETPSAKPSITIKKYANRRLYNTATSSYVTLETLAVMVKEGAEFNVYDAKTSEDITRSVLTQIIVEEENKSGQQNLLPISFLRQLIGFYGDNMQWVVPKYLEHSMQMLANNQEQLSSYFQTTFGNMFPFGTTFEEMSKQNLAMFERAMRMFAPFTATAEQPYETPRAESFRAEPACRVKEEPEASATVTNINRRNETPPPESACVAEEPVVGAPAPKVVAPAAAPKAAAPSPAKATPMPNVQSATSTVPGADDMQQKIANLQRQLADLAKNRA